MGVRAGCGIIAGGRSAIIFLFPGLGLLCGLTVALAARQQIRGGAAAWRESYLPGMLLFLALVPLPLGVYLFASYPAWSTLYLLDPAEVG